MRYLRTNLGIALILVTAAVSGCSTPCDERSPSECNDASECRTVYASKIDNECATKGTPVACTEDTNCDTSLAIARDANGHEWLFNDLCIPRGWTIARYDPIPPTCE